MRKLISNEKKKERENAIAAQIDGKIMLLFFLNELSGKKGSACKMQSAKDVCCFLVFFFCLFVVSLSLNFLISQHISKMGPSFCFRFLVHFSC